MGQITKNKKQNIRTKMDKNDRKLNITINRLAEIGQAFEDEFGWIEKYVDMETLITDEVSLKGLKACFINMFLGTPKSGLLQPEERDEILEEEFANLLLEEIRRKEEG
jgi:hypothetical protein|tara:strand:+ start:877 stop:1200 length:324 start_codon:yes stop_codon:yes gene_type:complete